MVYLSLFPFESVKYAEIDDVSSGKCFPQLPVVWTVSTICVVGTLGTLTNSVWTNLVRTIQSYVETELIMGFLLVLTKSVQVPSYQASTGKTIRAMPTDYNRIKRSLQKRLCSILCRFNIWHIGKFVRSVGPWPGLKVKLKKKWKTMTQISKK